MQYKFEYHKCIMNITNVYNSILSLTAYIRLWISPLSENLPDRLSCCLISHDAVRLSTVSGMRNSSPTSCVATPTAITSKAVADSL